MKSAILLNRDKLLYGFGVYKTKFLWVYKTKSLYVLQICSRQIIIIIIIIIIHVK